MTELKSLLHYDALIIDSTRRSDAIFIAHAHHSRFIERKKANWRLARNLECSIPLVGKTGRNVSCCWSRLCICRVICTWRKGYWDAERIKFMGEGEETSPQSRKKLWKAAFRFRRNELWWPANYTRLQTMTMPLLTLRHKWILVSFHEVWHDHRQTRLTVASES